MKVLILALVFFGTVHCPLDEFAICHWSGKTVYRGAQSFQVYECTCGHKVYVKN
jgi:hypothetical protein